MKKETENTSSQTSGEVIDDKRFGPPKMLGHLTVWNNYDHDTCLATFRKKHSKELYGGLSKCITDKNFAHSTHRFIAGKTYAVMEIPILSVVAYEECVAILLKKPNVVLVGAQGIPLVYEFCKEQLTKGKWYLSLDTKDRLGEKDAWGGMVPYITAGTDGGSGYGIDLTILGPYTKRYYLLCFYEQE